MPADVLQPAFGPMVTAGLVGFAHHEAAGQAVVGLQRRTGLGILCHRHLSTVPEGDHVMPLAWDIWAEVSPPDPPLGGRGFRSLPVGSEIPGHPVAQATGWVGEDHLHPVVGEGIGSSILGGKGPLKVEGDLMPSFEFAVEVDGLSPKREDDGQRSQAGQSAQAMMSHGFIRAIARMDASFHSKECAGCHWKSCGQTEQARPAADR